MRSLKVIKLVCALLLVNMTAAVCQYTIDNSVSYAPGSGSGTTVFLSDGEISGALPIGFSFNFFGNNYTEFYMSENGFLTFDNAGINCCEQYIPNSSAPNNLIAAGWFDFEGSDITYFTQGTAPNRTLHVDIDTYNYCDYYNFISQIILYEGSNNVEIHTAEAEFTDPDYIGCPIQATQGIENGDGSIAFANPWTNYNPYSQYNEAVRYVAAPIIENDLGVSFTEEFYCSGNSDIDVYVSNTGTNTALNYYIDYELDGIAADSIIITDSLQSGSTAIVTLENFSFVAGESYPLKVWTYNPNDSLDNNTANDTLEVLLKTQLDGTITIGSTSSDYLTITDAAEALDSFGMCEDVVLSILPGTYNERLELLAIPGSLQYDITVQSSTLDSADVILSLDYDVSTSPIIHSQNNTEVTVQHLTLEATGSSCGAMLRSLSGGSLIVEHVSFKGFDLPNVSTSCDAIYSNETASVNIAHCTFENFSTGVQLDDRFSSTPIINLTVDNSSFNQFSGNCIETDGVDTVMVSNTLLQSDKQEVNGTSIARNSKLVSLENIEVYLNEGRQGLYVWNGGFSNVTKVHNCVVSLTGDSFFKDGIVVTNGGSVDIAHNNISIDGTNGGSGVILNNVSGVFQNNVVGVFMEKECMSISNNSVNADHNLYYSPLAIGFYNGQGPFITLSDWTNGTGQDENSVFGNPDFTGFNDLHVGQTLVNGRAAITVPPTTTDIDGETRNTTSPDIGADEILAVANDIAIVDVLLPDEIVAGDFEIQCVVTNNADAAVSSYKVAHTVNGGAPVLTTVSNTLAPQAKDTITLPMISASVGMPVAVVLNTQEPNSVADTYLLNDTLILDTIYAKLNGPYTVGGSTPDFSTLEEATEALSAAGLIDSIVFLVRPGSYSASAHLDPHPSFDCDKPIIFTSESGVATDVVLNNIGSDGPVLSFDDVLGLEIKNLTIEGQDFAHSKGVYIAGESGCIKIHDCVFNGVPVETAATGDYNIDIQFNIDTCHIYDNVLTGADYSIFVDGGSTFPFSSFNNNTITSRSRAIYVRDSDNLHIRNNTLTLEGTVTNNSYVIQLYQCDKGYVIDGNSISKQQSDGGYGIYTSYSSGLSTDRATISNNFISSKFTSGIYLGPVAGYTDIYHNTVRLSSNVANSSGIQFWTGANIRIKNNISSIESGNGVPVFTGQNSTTNFESDYNDFHNATGPIAVRFVTDYTLTDWQATGRDGNSTDLDPIFADTVGYEVQGAHLSNMATPLASVQLDIEGTVRDAVSPDIGCVELSLFAEDVGILSINYPTMPFPSGENYTFIKFINNGQDTLTSMKVNWEVNGGSQPEYTWTGLLSSAETYDSLDIGTYDFQPYETYDIKVWVSQPNGLIDGLATNDTLLATGLVPALAGDYTVGGSEPDFETLSEAAAALNAGGVIADVTFLIRPGIYADTVVIQDFVGASCEHTVTFTSENYDKESVVISNLGFDGYPFRIIGADGITIEHLTIENYSTTHPTSIYATGSTNCFEVSSSKIISKMMLFSTTNAAVSRTSNTADSLVTIVGNEIVDSHRGVSLTSSGAATANVVISDNIMQDIAREGIYTLTTEGLIIDGNTLVSNIADHETTISVIANTEGLTVSNNRVVAQNSSTALYINDCHNTAGNKGVVYNNFITVKGTSATEGIYQFSTSHIDVYNNTIYHDSPSSSTINVPMIFWQVSDCRVYNNILYSVSGTHSYYYISLTNSSIDNNCYFPLATDFAYDFVGANYLDYSNWQSLFGFDANSVSVDPDFIGAPSDLHVRATPLYNTGSTVLYAADDIDGETRDTMPDIGADEFEPLPSDDAGVISLIGPTAPFASGSQSVLVAIKNYGGNVLTTADIQWMVNGSPQPTYSYSGGLAAGACDTVSIGSFDFQDLGAYQCLFWAEQPNGVLDSFPQNDTLGAIDLYHGLQGVYTVGGSFPDFFNINAVEDQVQYGGVLGTTEIDLRAGNYSTNLHWYDYPRLDDSYLTISGVETDSTAVTFTPAVNALPLVELENVHHLVFENITFQHQFARLLLLADSTNHVTVQGARFEGKLSNGHSSIEALAEGIHDLQILNSHFENGRDVIKLNGSAAETETGLLIEGNTFKDYGSYGVQATHQDDITISGNTFILEEDFNPRDAVSVSRAHNGYDVSGNKMYLDFGGDGISVTVSTLEAGKTGLISNNFIEQDGDESSFGIYLSSISDFEVFHNTLVHHSSNGMPIYLAYHSGGEIKNNNMIRTSDGLLLRSVFQQSAFASDHNNLYSAGPIASLFNTGQTYATLSDWQTGTGKDLNSISVDPLFVTANDPTIAHPLFNNVGVPTAVDEDIAGNTRSSTLPDLGATEFDVPTVDIRLLEVLSPSEGCDLTAAEPFTLLVLNQGQSTLTDATVSYSIDGEAFVSETVTGLSIQTGMVDTINTSLTIDLSNLGTYDIVGAISVTNDSNTNNDTLAVEFSNNSSIAIAPALVYPLSTDPPTSNTVTASWTAVPLASGYRLYYWLQSSTEVDTLEDIPVNTILLSDLVYDTTYQYYVEAFDNCGNSTTSDTASFTVEALPDIFVSSVTAPATAFNNSPVTVSWVVANDTEGSTGMKTWSDVIYLSEDATYNPSVDIFLGIASNTSALIGIDNYVGSKEVTLPGLTIGEYFIIVVSDKYNNVSEEDENNNVGYTAQKILIQVSPSVDFLPTAISLPTVQFNNDTLYYSWTVSNMGDAPTTTADVWRDYVYLSRDSLTLDVEMILGTSLISEVLQPDSSVTLSGQKYIPADVLGDFWIHAEIDRFNNVFEFTSESNNTRVSDRINIINPPLPDLVHVMHNLPDTIDPYQIVNPTVIFKNDGLSDVQGYFENKFYHGISPIFNTNYLTLLQSKGYAEVIKPDSIATQDFTWRTPQNISGDHYFYHRLDLAYNHEIIESDEENNVIQEIIYIRPVDVLASNLSFVSSTMADDLQPFSVDFINTGEGDFHGQSYKLGVYISDIASYNDQAVLLYSKFYNMHLATGDTLNLSGDVEIPYDQVGNKFMHFVFDREDKILESDETNNVTSQAITVFDAGTKDLTASVSSIPDTLYEGKTYSLGYTLENIGDIAHEGATSITIYMSTEPVWNVNNAVFLAAHNVADGINELGSPQLTYVTIPPFTPPNTVYFYFWVDPNDIITEINAEANNIIRSEAVDLLNQPTVDVSVTMVTVGSSTPFSNTSVSSQVTLSRDLTEMRSGTIDLTYNLLATDPGGQDFMLETNTVDWPSASTTLVIDENLFSPAFAIGDYDLEVVADISGKLAETNTVNNIFLMTPTLSISEGLTADLTFTSVDAPTEAQTGQSLDLIFSADNIGTSTAANYKVGAYLSSDYILDDEDLPLGFVTVVGQSINEVKTDTITSVISASYTGSYVIIYKADAGDAISEINGEENNLAFSPIVISLPPPADLIVSQVSSGDTLNLGDVFMVEYTITNNGEEPANGVNTDQLYLSKDNVLDVTDILLCDEQYGINLLPSQSITRSRPCTMQGVLPGEVFILIETNTRNFINESDVGNNFGHSDPPLVFEIEEIEVEESDNEVRDNNQSVYYKLYVDPAYANETIQVDISSPNNSGFVKSYMSYEAMPTEFDQEYIGNEPFQDLQRMYINAADPGDYYILCKGEWPSGNSDSLRIDVSYQPMKFDDVQPSFGLQGTVVTTRVEGAGLTNMEYFRLRNDSLFINHQTSTFEEISPNLTYVTFDLDSLPVDVYDYDGVKNTYDLAYMPQYFNVIDDEVDNTLSFTITGPPSTFGGQTVVPLLITWENTGNVDLVNPSLLVSAPGGNVLAQSIADLENGLGTNELIIYPQEAGGPANGIIRPGATGTVHVVGYAGQAPLFTLERVD